MGPGGGTARVLWRAGGVFAAIAASLAFAAPASAHRRDHHRHFPVPKCGWVSGSVIHHEFGVGVRAKKGYWKTRIAPVLTCNAFERHPDLQEPGKPIVQVQFREMQRFRPSSRAVFVPHLGSCRRRSSCPRGHKAAWLLTDQSDYGTSTIHTSATLLAVEDGLNAIVIEVVNPFGALPVASEVKATEHLARELVPRFRWK